MRGPDGHDAALARRLILDELFDLSLYQALRGTATGRLRAILEQLIPIETRHLAFWQDFFNLKLDRLDVPRRLKLMLLVAVARLFGAPAIHLILEAIEVYGVRKYLTVWRKYERGPLGKAVRSILEDEFKHEDMVVTAEEERRISPQRVRDIFLGLNDGLVEILGAVSGFFGAFGNAATVLIAGSTVAVAGALSMGAGAYLALSSEAEVRGTEAERRRFLGEPEPSPESAQTPLASGFLVGASYLAGALVPVLPVAFGARTLFPSLAAAGVLIVAVSAMLAFLTGMDVRRRIVLNLAIMAAAVGITYAIGTITRAVWGIAV
ncbi:MAG TPA: VIT1/CCC1 transporter family protein [Methylomirabilota bacterium]|nr:VIT1/CCC1 transporter family protein [Methylomirabilota bacterium]